jgi:hypothetical protein
MFAHLRQRLAEPRRGHGRLTILSGEAGIGKTKLVDAFTAGLPRATRVLRGSCDPDVPCRAFAPIIDIAAQVGRGLQDARTPDGHGRIERDKFRTPPAVRAEPEDTPVNALGIRRIMFAVDDIDAVLARLRTTHGAELVGEVQYENSYRPCYVRGPEGIMVALAEPLG